MAPLLFKKFPEIVYELAMFQDKTALDWSRDGLRLSLSKIARKAASSNIILKNMEKSVGILERYFAYPGVLRPLYRWIIGAYIYRGYQAGLQLNSKP